MSSKDCLTKKERADWGRFVREFDNARTDGKLIQLVAKSEGRRMTADEWARHDALRKIIYAALMGQAKILDRIAARERKDVERFDVVMGRAH